MPPRTPLPYGRRLSTCGFKRRRLAAEPRAPCARPYGPSPDTRAGGAVEACRWSDRIGRIRSNSSNADARQAGNCGVGRGRGARMQRIGALRPPREERHGGQARRAPAAPGNRRRHRARRGGAAHPGPHCQFLFGLGGFFDRPGACMDRGPRRSSSAGPAGGPSEAAGRRLEPAAAGRRPVRQRRA